MGGIQSSYVKKCLRSCATCDNDKLWDEVHNIFHHLLNVTLDQICIKYMVLRKLRRNYKCKGQIVKYYHCHRSENKRHPHRKTSFSRPSQEKDANQDKKSRLCNCFFQIKTIEAIRHDNCDSDLHRRHVTIFVHTQHTGHVPGSEADIIFLPMHPMVMAMAKENLKMMISTSTVALASNREVNNIKAIVTELERVTYRFFIIAKEVAQLRHSMRLNGTLYFS